MNNRDDKNFRTCGVGLIDDSVRIDDDLSERRGWKFGQGTAGIRECLQTFY